MNDSISSSDRLVKALNKETRYCVLDCSVFMEAKASDTLGRLLEISWRESESLGYGSACLGFDQKIRLIQDIKGISTETKTKFQSFMAIRNKFAHMEEIDSFANYFKLIKSSKARKKELKKWYPNIRWDSEDIEGIYKFAYFRLTLELFRALFDIDSKHAFEKGKKQGIENAKQMFIDNIRELLEATEEGRRTLNETFEKINKNGG